MSDGTVHDIPDHERPETWEWRQTMTFEREGSDPVYRRYRDRQLGTRTARKWQNPSVRLSSLCSMTHSSGARDFHNGRLLRGITSRGE